MDDLFNILNDGKAHVKVEMDAADLKAFSDELIRRAKDELGTMVEKPVKTGNKVLYPEYEVRKALGKRNQII